MSTDFGGLNLATAAEDIKIWDCSNGYSIIKQFNPHSGPVSSVVWSHDNNFLASSSSVGDKVTITCCKNNVYSMKDLHVKGDHTCVAFNSHSRYLLSGGKNGLITVFDLKTQKQKKTYKDHKGAISSLTFNWNDTYIASGSVHGEIILYNVVTAQGSSPMHIPNEGAVTQLQYSHYKKSLLGSVSEDGAVCLWDTNTRRLMHSFTDKHCACPMGLAFSPINKMLLMSVGLDKRIVCYDVIGNTAVKTITADNGLTCIDVMQDGVTLATGSVRGTVFIYDLRKGTQPITTINAHKEAVNKLVFQSNFKPPKSDSRSSRKTASSSTSSSSSSSVPIKDQLTDNKYADINSNLEGPSKNDYQDMNSENRPDVVGRLSVSSVASKNSSMASDGVFSPLNENWRNVSGLRGNLSQQSNVSSASQSPSLSRQIFSPISNHDQQQLTAASAASAGESNVCLNGEQQRDFAVVTPLPGQTAASIYSVQSSVCASPETIVDGSSDSSDSNTTPRRLPGVTNGLLKTNNTPSSLVATRLQALKQLEQASNDQSLPNGSPYQSSSIKNAESKDLNAVATESNLRKPVNELESGASTPVMGKGRRTPIVPEVAESNRTPTNSPPTMKPSPYSLNPELYEQTVVDKARAAAYEAPVAPPGGGAPNQFHMEFIRNTIEDVMEEFRDQVRSDMLHLQMEMLRQFQVQQAEICGLLHQYSVNEQVTAELQQLREENKRLKRKF
ncbi:protein NEDD1-like [Tubulanus polymorphus]|uniref:protein NEDD1-like n=1 Tax=Tubulanus polymorphus TaxID=672921 RepID=UPI003DA3E14A